MNRTQKIKLLSELLNGRADSLKAIHQSRELNPAKMSDEQLYAEHERLRRKTYQKTGILPPPMPNFSVMSDHELNRQLDILEQRRNALLMRN